jgi:C4-dicarboxylate-specific signal transduction histidine kinase
MSAKQETTGEPVDLNGAIRNVMAISQSQLERNRVLVREEPTDNLPQLRGIRVRLQPVTLNLPLNASDAINIVGSGSTFMTVRTKVNDDGSVQVEVQDLGVGAALEVNEKHIRSLLLD